MKKHVVASFLGAALFLAVACTGKKNESFISSLGGNDDIVVIDIDKAKEEKILLYSNILEEPDVIVLETNPECVVQNIRALDIFDDNIYILDDASKALYVFRRDGSFLKRIGSEGNGHGEYWELSDFSINRKDSTVYLWDEALDRALKFDLRTGGYLSSIQTERVMGIGAFACRNLGAGCTLTGHPWMQLREITC